LPAPGGPSNTIGPMFCEVSIELTYNVPCSQVHAVSSLTTRRPGGTATSTFVMSNCGGREYVRCAG